MRTARYILVLLLFTAGIAGAVAPNFADMAVLLAKGYFGNYVKRDAPLERCAMFLNGKGVSFSLFDLVDPNKAVTREDLARAVGQSMLLFSGEAEVVNGRIKKPLEAETWVDYCLLNDIDLNPIWNGFVRCTAEGNLPEVRKFFKR
ncbi:MAG: hypothetical protein HOO88_08965 [Kiritimatiellaceae bacterium]|nr:hypothetical protein [Kiritimatiellaceae bacterium]